MTFSETSQSSNWSNGFHFLGRQKIVIIMENKVRGGGAKIFFQTGKVEKNLKGRKLKKTINNLILSHLPSGGGGNLASAVGGGAAVPVT